MERPNDPTETTPRSARESAEGSPSRAWFSTLGGVGLLAYTGYWLDNPSAQGLGRFFRVLYKGLGKWPIAILFAAGGIWFLSIGLRGLLRRSVQRR